MMKEGSQLPPEPPKLIRSSPAPQPPKGDSAVPSAPSKTTTSTEDKKETPPPDPAKTPKPGEKVVEWTYDPVITVIGFY